VSSHTTTTCDVCGCNKGEKATGWGRLYGNSSDFQDLDLCSKCLQRANTAVRDEGGLADKAIALEAELTKADKECNTLRALHATAVADVERLRARVTHVETQLNEYLGDHYLVERTASMLVGEAGMAGEATTQLTVDLGVGKLIQKYEDAVEELDEARCQIEAVKADAADTANYEEAYRVEEEKNRHVAQLNADLQKAVADLRARDEQWKSHFVRTIDELIDMLGKKRTKRNAERLRELLDGMEHPWLGETIH
jgi:hypothetical protein